MKTDDDILTGIAPHSPDGYVLRAILQVLLDIRAALTTQK